LILTILLGATFTCVQAFEYAHAAFSFAGNIYALPSSWRPVSTASMFWSHIFLIVCLLRAYAGHFSPTQHLGFEFAACTGISSTWCGCSCSSASMSGATARTMAHGAH